MDTQQLIARADIVLDTPVHRSEAGLPIGNGRVGSLVWTVPTAMRLQINRVDVFPCNRQTDSFHFHESYCCGCGFVDVDLGDADVFTDDATHQHLSVYDALLTLRGRGVEIQTLAWHAEDVIAVRVQDRRDNPQPFHVRLRMLREPVAVRHSHRAESSFEERDGAILLRQNFSEGDHFCASVASVKALGRPCTVKQVHERELSLCLPAGTEPVTILIASAATFKKDDDIDGQALDALRSAAARAWDGLVADNAAWWRDFWSKSYIELRSENGDAEFVEQHYTYYLYVMGASSRGAYPPKFNGMLWSTGGDMRMWGAQYWWNNTCLMYRALPATNHIDLMEPIFNLYSGMTEAAAWAARDIWKSEGVYIPETVWFDGPEEMPPDIAAEASDLFLFRKPWAEHSEAFMQHAQTKNEFSCWWNWHERRGPCTNGRWTYHAREGSPSGYITHIFGSMARIAYQYWLRYAYTGDVDWLRDRGYPMLKNVAEFFRHFPNLRRGADGMYHIHKVNQSEGGRGVTDAMECMVGMRGVLSTAIRASETLGVDAALRTEWTECLANLGPLPTSDHPDAIRRNAPGEPAFWVGALKPADQGGGEVLLDPVTHCDICTLETNESNPDLFRTAESTYRQMHPDGVNERTPVGVMWKTVFEAARLGRGEDVRHFLLNQLRVLSLAGDFEAFDSTLAPNALENRMTLREGVQALEAERLGNAASGLQEALVQSIPPAPGEPSVIRVFPAWPSEWDARFRLLCRGGFLVGSEIEDGHIVGVEVCSQIGGTCRIRNPWSDQTVEAQHSDGRTETLTGSLIVLATQAGETFTLRPCS